MSSPVLSSKAGFGLFATFFFSLCVLTSASTVRAELAITQATSDQPASPPQNCSLLYKVDDPRLFNFVETRDQVDYSQYQGYPILGIQIVVLPIFNEADPKEDNWLFLWANQIHPDTRPSTLRKQLLITSGEPLDQVLLEESERILRDNGYVADAMIVPAQVCPDGIFLLVVMRDVWTLKPTLSLSRSGGSTDSVIGFTDDNILGSGRRASFSYKHSADRNGLLLSYKDAHVGNSNNEIRLHYENNNDGELIKTALSKPFYSLNSKESMGVTLHDESRLDTITNVDTPDTRYQHDIEKYEVFYGWSAGLIDDIAHRWRLSYHHEEDHFAPDSPDQPAPPENRRLIYPELSFESIENDYIRTTNISQFFRIEDLLIGTRWTWSLGIGDDALGSTDDFALLKISHSYTNSIGDHHLFRTTTYLDSQWNTTANRAENSFSGFNIVYYGFIDSVNRWKASTQFDYGRHLSEDKQLTVGGELNLPGYSSGFQRGNRRLLFSVERRRFFNWHPFQLVHVGAAAFFDAGKVWNSETPNAPNSHWLSDIGVGFRLASSKATADKLLHIDLVVPLSERDKTDKYQFILEGRKQF